MKFKAFTLIELVIAAAILTVGVSFILPNFKNLLKKLNESKMLLSSLYSAQQQLEKLNRAAFAEINSCGSLEVTEIENGLKKIELNVWKNHKITTLRSEI